MTDDPNKKQNDPSQSGGQQRNYGQQPNNPNDPSQRRPTQGGHDVEQDEQEQNKGGQRKAS